MAMQCKNIVAQWNKIIFHLFKIHSKLTHGAKMLPTEMQVAKFGSFTAFSSKLLVLSGESTH